MDILSKRWNLSGHQFKSKYSDQITESENPYMFQLDGSTWMTERGMNGSAEFKNRNWVLRTVFSLGIAAFAYLSYTLLVPPPIPDWWVIVLIIALLLSGGYIFLSDGMAGNAVFCHSCSNKTVKNNRVRGWQCAALCYGINCSHGNNATVAGNVY
jgi:hypothetical protein